MIFSQVDTSWYKPKNMVKPWGKGSHKPQTEFAYGNELTPWSTVFPEKLSKNFLYFMEPNG